jgi:hypothetical protein
MNRPTRAFRTGSLVIALLALLLSSLFGWKPQATNADSKVASYLPVILNRSPHVTESPTSQATAIATHAPPATATATLMPTSAAMDTPTATASATPSATSTATATATVTETPVVRCSIYPITLHGMLLDGDDFRPPMDPDEKPYFGTYNSPIYGQKTMRRIYLTDLGFHFARWRASTPPSSASALVASLSGTGNFAQGFDEAPWPSGTAFGPQPAGYPTHPGQLNASDGDWIYGSNASVSSDVLAALQNHIDSTTLLTLPIHDGVVGSGSNVTYHVERLGDFLVRGYGNQGGQWYLDLVSIGNSTAPQCE